MKNDSWDDLDIPVFLRRDKNEPLPDWKPRTRAPELAKPRMEPDAATIAAFEMKEMLKSIKRLGKVFDPETHRWDAVRNRWVPIRIYHKESTMRPDFLSMDLPMLKQAYNEMAVEAAKLELPVLLVKKFGSKNSAVRRCEELYKSICTVKGEAYEEPISLPEIEPEEPDDKFDSVNLAMLEPSKKSAEKSAAKQAKETTKSIKQPAGKNTGKFGKKIAKKKIKAPEPKKEPKKDQLPITAALGLKTGSKHEQIAVFLSADARLGKMILEKLIVKHLYGDPEKKTNRITDLMKVMRKDKYELRKDEKDGVVSYGLYPKK